MNGLGQGRSVVLQRMRVRVEGVRGMGEGDGPISINFFFLFYNFIEQVNKKTIKIIDKGIMVILIWLVTKHAIQ